MTIIMAPLIMVQAITAPAMAGTAIIIIRAAATMSTTGVDAATAGTTTSGAIGKAGATSVATIGAAVWPGRKKAAFIAMAAG